ncbi:mechanosensitive ion channel [Gramella sp. GC03-9]|uniref:Mechanosensitive ion channel n=1 Tax=Christiangramia oceanisediminis TaxID=2920386 RepID=A0A9X2I7A5_9FLAO|nr:mechanosensitive ion channel domain-containing protein [Gramella oceanisediminis]MCP9198999.1 mechanosensitive ion channel [Gramella oceanisediminis]
MFRSLPSSNYFLLSLVLMVLPLLTHAQVQILEPEVEEVEQDSIPVEEVQATPLDQIVREIETTKEEVRSIEKRLDLNISNIDSLFPFYERFLDQQKIEVDRFFTANPNREKVDNVIIKWQGFKKYLGEWETSTNELERRNSIILDRLRLREKTWELNYENALAEELPIELVDNIRETLNQIVELRIAIEKRNNELLILETNINQEINQASEVIEDLMALKRSEMYGLFHQRIPPVWETGFRGLATPSRNENMNSLEITRVEVLRFLNRSKNSLPLFLLLVGLIIGFVYYCKRAFKKYPDVEEDLDLIDSRKVLTRHHVVVICLLSLLLARYFFVPVPKLFLDISSLLLLVCSIPIVWILMGERYKSLVYFAIIIFVLNSLKSHVWFNAEQYRIFLLLESVFVIMVIYFYTRPYFQTFKEARNKFTSILLKLVPVIYAFVFIAMIAVLAGYVNLADFILKIFTRSGPLLIWLLALLMTLNSVFLSIIHRHYKVKTIYSPQEKYQTEKKVLRIIKVVLVFLGVLIFLRLIDQLAPIVGFIRELLSEPYVIGQISFTLNDVFSFLLILVSSFLITRIIAFIFNDEDGFLRFLKLPKGVPTAVSIVIRYLVIAFGIVFALSSLGINLSEFNLMAGALGLGIGFGLQTVISNFISGLILVFERPILKGDTVEVDNLLGTVNRIGIRSSNITTFDGAEVIVPNNNLISNDLINWTLSNNTKRVEVFVGTTYGSDPNKVLKILYTVAKDHKNTLPDPPPQALFLNFGESSLNFTLRFWVHYENWLQARSDVSIDIYNAFKEANIHIPFPQRDIYIKSMPGVKDKEEPEDSRGPDMRDTSVPEVKVPIEHRDKPAETKTKTELDPSEDDGSSEKES